MTQISNSKGHKEFQGRHIDTPSKGSYAICNKVIEIRRKCQLFGILPNSCTAMISAILLAAGESNRMGQPKQLLPFGQSTILERTIDNLLDSAISETIVVMGYKEEEIRKTIADKPVKIAINPDYQQGMSTSIIAGLKQINKRARAVLIALGDQPFVDSQTITSLVEAFIANSRGIIIPVYQGRRGNPVIFAIRYKGELLNLKGDTGGREIIKRHPDDVLEVAVNCEGVLLDIDTMESYTSITFNPDK